jgi:O-antigen ligase
MLSLGLGLISLLIAVMLIKHPAMSIPSLILALPFQRLGSFALFPTLGYPIVQPVQVVGLSVILAVVYRVSTGRTKPLPIPRPLYLLITLLVIALIPVLSIGYPQLRLDWVSAGFTLTLCAAVAIEFASSSLRLVWGTLASVAVGLSIFGFYQFIAGSLGYGPEVTGLLGRYARDVFGFPRVQATMLEPLFLANLLLTPILVGLTRIMLIGKGRSRSVAIVVLSSLCFVLTLSRGAFIGLAVGLCFVGVATWKQTLHNLRRYWISVIAFSFIILSLSVGFLVFASLAAGHQPLDAPRQFASLVGNKFNQTGTLTDRFKAEQSAFKIYWERPWFGLGIGGYTFRVLGYPVHRTAGDRVVVNNEFLEVLLEVGAVGLICYLAFLGSSLYLGYKRPAGTDNELSSWSVGLSAATLATLVQLLSFSGFFTYHIWVLLGLLVGIGARMRRQKIS